MIKNNVSGWSISSQLLLEESEKMGIELQKIQSEKNLFLMRFQGKEVLSKNIDCGLNSSLGYKVTEDKELTYALLDRIGIPVPKSLYIASKDIDSISIQNIEIGTPLVVKPVDGAHGDWVSVDICIDSDLKRALKKATEYSEEIIVQNYVHGFDHRIFVVWDQVIAVAKREPASIIGDGKSTIHELIDQENTNPLRGGWDHATPLSPIKEDDESQVFLSKKWLSFESIPLSWEKVFLRWNANLSTGGKAIDLTDTIHPSVIQHAIRAVKTVWLVVAGVDVLTDDISQPLEVMGGVIIEINATPGLRMHHFPSEGVSRNPARAILQKLFF